jgi:hypothetical protein
MVITVDEVGWYISTDKPKLVSKDGIIEAWVEAKGGVEWLFIHETPEGIILRIPLEVARTLIQSHDSRV